MKRTVIVGSSIDGKISPARGISSKIFGTYLDNKISLELHKIRSKADAIMISSNTILTDNPSLTVRGLRNNKKLIKVIIDRRGIVKNKSKIFEDYSKIIFITSNSGKKKLEKLRGDFEIIVCKTKNNKINLNEALLKLEKRGIKNLLIEAGGEINYSLFKNYLIDEIVSFTFPFVVGGRNTPTIVDGEKSFFNNFKRFELVKSSNKYGTIINTYVKIIEN